MENTTELLKPELLTGLLAVAVSLLALLNQWRTFRALSQARFRDLDERNKAVKFWVDWIAAIADVASETDLVAHRKLAHANLQRLAMAAVQTSTRPPFLLSVQRLVLVHKPRRRWVWIARTPFYLSAAYTLFLVFSVGEVDRGRATILEYLGVTLLFVFITMIFWVVATLLDGDFGRPPAPTPVSE